MLVAVAINVGSGVEVAIGEGVLVTVAVNVESGVDVAVGAGVFVVVGSGVSVDLLEEGWVWVGVFLGVTVAVGSGVFVGIVVGSGVQVSVRFAVGLRVGTTVSVARLTTVVGVERGETGLLVHTSQPSNILISTPTNTHLQAHDHRWSNPVATCGRTIFSPARRNALTIPIAVE